MVPILDLSRQYQALKPEIDAAVLNLLASGQFILGPAVAAFEEEAARALQVGHVVGVANGTDALQLCLEAMGVGLGDEVITTPFTFIATAEVISRLGATPVFVDIEADTFNIDPVAVEAAITSRTRAIIPVHLFGHAAEMDRLNQVAARHNLRVLEDAAQAWGAFVEDDAPLGASGGVRGRRYCGALGDMATFSFYPTKNLGGAGDGGLVTTNNDELAAHVRVLREHGQKKRYISEIVGTNSRLDGLQAAILQVKLPHAEAWNDARRANAARLNELLQGLPVATPVERLGVHHVYHQYTLRVPKRRDEVCQSLTAAGIGWAVYYPVCLHQQPVYQSLGYREGQLPVAEQAAREVVSLPVFPELRPDELEAIAAAVRAAF